VAAIDTYRYLSDIVIRQKTKYSSASSQCSKSSTVHINVINESRSFKHTSIMPNFRRWNYFIYIFALSTTLVLLKAAV